MSYNAPKKPVTVAVAPPVRIYSGSSDVAYTNGAIPNTGNRDFWTSVATLKPISQEDTDKAYQNKEPVIAAKIATDLANQKQAAAAATNVVNSTVASQAGVAARDAVAKANQGTKQIVGLGVAAVVAVVAAGIYFLKRKTKHA